MVPLLINALRMTLAGVLSLSLWHAATAKADSVETLMVPSLAMGRDIPVAFQAGGPHAVVLLDAFNGAPDVSNWRGTGAFNSFAGKGVSVAAPAGGAWSMYTNWENDGSKQWETFLAGELPNWLAANKGLAPDGHCIVGPAQGGTAVSTLAAFRPDRFRYAGSMSGFLTPSATTMNGTISVGLAQHGGVNPQAMWGGRAARPVEVARPRRTRSATGGQRHSIVGVQPVDAHLQRSCGDDRILRPGAGEQPQLLSALSRCWR